MLDDTARAAGRALEHRTATAGVDPVAKAVSFPARPSLEYCSDLDTDDDSDSDSQSDSGDAQLFVELSDEEEQPIAFELTIEGIHGSDNGQQPESDIPAGKRRRII